MESRLTREPFDTNRPLLGDHKGRADSFFQGHHDGIDYTRSTEDRTFSKECGYLVGESLSTARSDAIKLAPLSPSGRPLTRRSWTG